MRWLLPYFFVALLAACGYGSVPPVREAGELVVLTRGGPTTYSLDETLGAVGFEHDLAALFAEELGVKARFIVAASDAEIYLRLKKREAHLAAAWLTPVDDPGLRSAKPYFQSANVVVTHEASLPLNDIAQLAGKSLHVVAESRQAAALLELKSKVPTLAVVGETERGELDLLEGVASQRLEAAVVDRSVFDIGGNYYPELQGSLKIGPSRPVAWLLAVHGDPDLPDKADAFLTRAAKDGTMARLRDRYFGHVERLNQTDIVTFVERIRKVLPQYRPLFQAAQASTGVDWRLLAALAYQESQWDPLATSPTGVRGMMMLTGDTADHLGVSNRLDPKLSIRAGAQYLSDLRDALPAEIREPDRLWLALAAYNLGMGHLQAARSIAKSVKANPNLWYEMKKVLPLLARPEYYERLKSGAARGGEAVMLVENIRIFSDILNRYESAHHPLEEMAGMTGMEGVVGMAGLKAKYGGSAGKPRQQPALRR
ncbi:MAG: membrane-bound lytic murein transglycosylase MltF [Betaproteobacteria bacterium]|nr:membrane-bound lytic murein transglycosylase MltF [Betaproteobacteria bacterium]